MRSLGVCPVCGSGLVGTLIYPYRGREYVSRYCPECKVWTPKPKGLWTEWSKDKRDYSG